MQAPGFRMNERESNPNPYVGFIRALRQRTDHDDAEHILKAVAAQMKKIMEQRFMFVHTLEEAAYNRVFAGRNWNYGQSIELVLRGPSGNFLPLPYVISVMCHEMAHIQQMNHGPKFQKLMAEIKADVRNMQAKGYFGDGFWSNGHRLRDSARMGAQSLRRSDLPEYVCGVTTGDATRATRPRRRPVSSPGTGLVKGEASHRSGRQTEYKRKAGRRINVDMGTSSGRLDGRREITKQDTESRQSEIDERAQVLVTGGMNPRTAKARAAREWNSANPWYVEGSTRGKVAKSKTAAEMRAEAAERRLAAVAGPTAKVEDLDSIGPKLERLKSEEPESNGDDDDDEEVQDPHLDPDQRKKDIERDTNEQDRKVLRDEWEEFFENMKSQDLGKRGLSTRDEGVNTNAPKRGGKALVDEEVKRGLGLASTSRARSGKTLGGSLGAVKREMEDPNGSADEEREDKREHTFGSTSDWSCQLCTFVNIADHGRCEMCNARPDGTMPADAV